MHALSQDRKKYLLRQNRQFKTSSTVSTVGGQHTYSASYGPSSAAALLPKLVPQLTGDAGLMKRFSIVGWGSGTSPAPPVVSPDSINTAGSSKDAPNLPIGARAQVTKVSEELPPLQPQTTGSLWSSWWSSSGGEKPTSADKRNTTDSKSAKWYIDGLRTGRAPDMKLVKHLITLRVHLSTAKLAFIQDFVGSEKGLDALGALLASLVGKGGKRRALSEIETTVLLEVIKCLRVLLNTEVCSLIPGLP